MELWKKLGIVFGIVGAIYASIAIIVAIAFSSLYGDPYAQPPYYYGISQIQLLVLFIIFYPAIFTLTTFRIAQNLYFFIIYFLIWVAIFALIGVKLGKFIEKRRAKSQLKGTE